MLFTESELNVFNPLDILAESVYLTENESLTKIQTVPVIQNDGYNVNMIDFRDIDRISEEYGCDYIDAMSAIIESEQLNPEYTTVVIDEADFILEAIDGTVFSENTIIRPLSEYDSEYQFVQECVEAFLESYNDEYLLLLEMPQDQWGIVNSNPHLSDEAKKKIGAMFMGDQRVDDDDLAVAIARAQSGKNKKVDPVKRTRAEERRRSQDLLDTQEENMNAKHKREMDSANQDLAYARKQTRDFKQGFLNTQHSLNTANQLGLAQLQRAERAEAELGRTGAALGKVSAQHDRLAKEYGEYRGKGLHRAADKLYAAGNWMKNNKGKTALGLGAAAAVGAGIYAYKQYKNKPKSVIAKRIAALRGIYRKFMLNAQRNPQKAGVFKRIAAKILSVIDKLMAFLQNKADGR